MLAETVVLSYDRCPEYVVAVWTQYCQHEAVWADWCAEHNTVSTRQCELTGVLNTILSARGSVSWLVCWTQYSQHEAVWADWCAEHNTVSTRQCELNGVLTSNLSCPTIVNYSICSSYLLQTCDVFFVWRSPGLLKYIFLNLYEYIKGQILNSCNALSIYKGSILINQYEYIIL